MVDLISENELLEKAKVAIGEYLNGVHPEMLMPGMTGKFSSTVEVFGDNVEFEVKYKYTSTNLSFELAQQAVDLYIKRTKNDQLKKFAQYLLEHNSESLKSCVELHRETSLETIRIFLETPEDELMEGFEKFLKNYNGIELSSTITHGVSLGFVSKMSDWNIAQAAFATLQNGKNPYYQSLIKTLKKFLEEE